MVVAWLKNYHITKKNAEKGELGRQVGGESRKLPYFVMGLPCTPYGKFKPNNN